MNESLDWIKKHKKHLSIRGINETLNGTSDMPLETLIKAVNNKRKLPKKWVKPLDSFIKTLRL